MNKAPAPAPLGPQANKVVETLLTYCVHCLKDLPPVGEWLECEACGEYLHFNCTRCLCKRLKKTTR
jgi:hypothetical protein